jgi:hypothetical protein
MSDTKKYANLVTELGGEMLPAGNPEQDGADLESSSRRTFCTVAPTVCRAEARPWHAARGWR